ncbi:MAG: NAD(P)-dependent oxidoreductase [Bacteroidota bacterium]
MKRCLIIDLMHESIIPMLSEVGYKVDYKPDITREEILDSISEYEGLILRSKTKIDKELLERADHIKFIARAGAGLDQIDESSVSERNIVIINSPEGNRDAVGEHTLGMILALFNKMNFGDYEVRNGQWKREANRGHELKNKTIGVLGYGNMGSAFAQRLQGFECKVIAYDKYKKETQSTYAEIVSQEEFFGETDVLSIHIPLSEENDQLVNRDYINNFKKPIYVINTARGSVLDLSSLCDAIKGGRVLGAAFDVLENEKLDKLSTRQKEDFEYLVEQNNTLFTPHVAGWSFESYVKINEVLCDKIRSLSI